MLKKWLNISSLLILLLLIIQPSIQALGLVDVEELILSKKPAELEKAIEILADITDGHSLYLLAKAHLYLGDQSEDNKLEIYEEGLKYADQAVEQAPDLAASHYWQAALMGRVGQTKGVLNSLFMVKPMRDALEKTLLLDEGYADAYWLLARLYQDAPGFPLSIGSKKKSLENAEKAILLEPNNVEFQLQLAKSLKYNDQEEQALQVLQEILENPNLQQNPEIKEEIEAILAKLS